MTSTEGNTIKTKVLTASEGKLLTNYLPNKAMIFEAFDHIELFENEPIWDWYEVTPEEAAELKAKADEELAPIIAEIEANSPEAQLEALYALIMDESDTEDGEE